MWVLNIYLMCDNNIIGDRRGECKYTYNNKLEVIRCYLKVNWDKLKMSILNPRVMKS